MPKYSTEDLLAIVVIYNTAVNESLSLRTLEDNKLKLDVVVYDNSPVPFLKNAGNPFRYLQINYLHNPSNPGVSTAYNYAADLGRKMNKRFLILLDQDTKLPSNALTTYLEAINSYPSHHLFAPRLNFQGKLFSPCKYLFKRGYHLKNITAGEHSLRKMNFLNSGLLISLVMYTQVGGYDESIKLYFSDFEFIDRVKMHLDAFILLNIEYEHELSSGDRSDKEKAITRFTFFCRDGRSAAKSGIAWVQYCLTIGLRAFKLSIYFKDTKFLCIFYTRYLMQRVK